MPVVVYLVAISAMAVAATRTGEVVAIVGGRRASFDGFNRALDAQRMEADQANADREFGYRQSRDQVGDNQWNESFSEDRRRYETDRRDQIQRDKAARKASRWGAIGSTLGGVLGGVGGFFLGGPAGAPGYSLNGIKFDPGTAGTCSLTACDPAGNVGKRLVKAPKVFVRDSGLVHALLGLRTLDRKSVV